MADNEQSGGTPEPAVGKRGVEAAVAAIILVLGLIVIYDSQRIGAGWASDGPQAGYFPFYVGIFICLSSVWILIHALFGDGKAARASFVSHAELKLVMSVLVPAIGFVIGVYFLGLYVAAALFIGLFMLWQGRFPWHTLLPVSLGVPVVLFMMFEIWFLVPLPKGPVEALFGY